MILWQLYLLQVNRACFMSLNSVIKIVKYEEVIKHDRKQSSFPRVQEDLRPKIHPDDLPQRHNKSHADHNLLIRQRMGMHAPCRTNGHS